VSFSDSFFLISAFGVSFSLFSALDIISSVEVSFFLLSASGLTGAKLSSVTVSGLTSRSIPIFFLIFSAILADLPVLSLK